MVLEEGLRVVRMALEKLELASLLGQAPQLEKMVRVDPPHQCMLAVLILERL